MKLRKSASVAVSVLLAILVTACGSSGNKVDQGIDSEFSAQRAALLSKEKELDRRAAQLASRESASRSGVAGPMTVGSEMLPPNAKAGECYTRIWQPAEYQTVTERKLVSEAGDRIEVIPAKYGKVSKRVLVQEASTKLVSVPATYKTVTERVMIQPARTESVQVPPVYKKVSERIIDKPAHTTWKKGTGPIQRIDDTTGEIMCLVEVPATYRTITRQVLKTPATTRSKQFPAVYKNVTRQVVVTAATTRTIELPARYDTITVIEQTRPAAQRRIPIEARYDSITRQKLVKDGSMQWREILCDTNTTAARVSQIQVALRKAGFNPGAADGTIGPGTMKAVNAFQRSKGLPVDKYLNVQTVRALGVSTR